MRRLTTGAALAALLLVPATLAAQGRETERALDWRGAIAAGKTLIVRNLNGEIAVERANGREAEVQAEKRWRRGDPEDVRIELRRLDGDDGGTGSVLVCALWGDRSSCDEDGYRTRSGGWNWGGRDNDVSVRFTVRLPDGVRLVTSSVNGGISVDGATAAVEAETVNGSITVGSTGGPVAARTVNGGIEVRMGTALRDDVSYETVNGSVDVTIPDGLDADLLMQTTNGSVRTDFPVTIQGKLSRRKLEATLGKGGPRLRLKTVNGDVRLRKG